MKRLIRLTTILLLCMLAKHGLTQTQPDSTKLCRIETIDGNEFVGIAISQDIEKVVVETSLLGKITINRNKIKSITWLKPQSVKSGRLWYDNPQSTRYFWTPNGYGLKKGEGYYQNIWVLWNQASIGVTDNFSIGAGVIPLFLFGSSVTPVWIVPKFSVPVVKDKLNLGAGAILGTVTSAGGTFGIAYGLATLGDRNQNLTLGLGYGFADGTWASNPVVTLGGMARISPNFYLLTDNYYLGFGSDYMVIVSVGGRSIIRRAAIDYGLFIPRSTGMGSFVGIPWLGLTIPFGKS